MQVSSPASSMSSCELNSDQDNPLAEFNDVTIEDNFATQLSAITQDFQNKFVNIKSIVDQEDSKGSTIRYYSHVRLESAIESFIEEDTVSGRLVFEARYSGTTVPEYAISAYETLKANIDYVLLSSCTLMEDKETITGNSRRQLYRAYLISDQQTTINLDFVVELAIVQGPTVGNVGEESIVWVPVIKVYGK